MMKKLIVVFAVLALCAGMAYAKVAEKTPVPYSPNQAVRANTTFWTDDMESGEGLWSHWDKTALQSPEFWRSDLSGTNYSPYGGDLSWWCGNYTWDAPGDLPGGYANDWNQYLVIPELNLAGMGSYGYGILTFAYRHDMEVDYDYCWVQAESLGVYTNLNKGYNGLSEGWQDYGVFGFLLGTYDDPLHARFFVYTDGAASDADGGIDSDAGAFMCDNIKVFEYGLGTVYFLDDAEDNLPDVCTPVIPAAAGDWWHIQDRLCKASSGTHVWWCGDDADTSSLPAGLYNPLTSPDIDVSMAYSCTVNTVITMAFAHTSGAWKEGIVYNGTPYEMAGWYGDQFAWGYGPCDLFFGFGAAGWSFIPGIVPAASTLGIYYAVTTDLGDPYPAGGNGDCGITIDDGIMYGSLEPVAVEETSWGSIKAMFK